jgi:hypothetical protein
MGSILARGDISVFHVRFLLVGLCVLLAACGSDRRVTLMPAQRILPTTPAATITLGVRPTLPPTWTSLPSTTPRSTNTATLSPTPLPTLTAKQICDDFKILAAPSGQVESDALMTFAWHGVPVDVPVMLSITQRESKQGLRLDMSVAGDSLLRVPMSRLPAEGDYDWKLWLQHPLFGEICPQSGTFTRKPSPFI